MKKTFIISLLSASLYMNAEVILPEYSYAEDFKVSLTEGKLLPDGWVTYGIGEKVGIPYQRYFGDSGNTPYFRVYNIDGQTAAWSCSTFVYANSADEWLVSPPIHINSDSELLKLKATAAGAFASNRYRVLISEKGQNKEDFHPIPVLNTTLTGWETEVRSKESYIPLNGYEGKDIYLAFINKSEDAGLLGFTDIAVAPYIIDVANLTPSVLDHGSKTDISLNVNVRTPVAVSGLKAELTYGDQTVTATYDQVIDQKGTRVLVRFNDITVPDGGLKYSVSVTPLMTGVQPTVVTGEIGTPTTSYPPVAVVEEFTGTWCTYCPRGAAFLNYYADKYTGEDDGLKVIGIALHVDNDPMLMDDPAYYKTAYAASNANGYPSAFFNRTALGDPSEVGIISEIEKRRSNSRISIDQVQYTSDGGLNVRYAIENSYSMSNMNQRVAIVMVENKVKGMTPFYQQSNGLSGVSKQAVINTYGEELWPYFQFFSEQPNPVPFMAMSYDHVARGIWPDYYGELLDFSCDAGIPVENEMRIEMPSQVVDPDNTAVIALLIDASTGNIISAAEMEAKEYNKDVNGIQQVDADSMGIVIDGGSLLIQSPCSGEVYVTSIDGTILLSASIESGRNDISLEGLNGIVIVRAITEGGIVKTAKFTL